ncbi:two-component system regulatory protein YycI [Aerococcaceae bacterium NML160702]|nr:two-component system regulatory protein YycI [Aerococcaceae bacterium NML180378]MCW6679889.1 two-component system regulatory protein YycI [Aerococcaceae bacterium NML130460]MCW6681710.1 two-component system regulatory protein YycI [Aerococcaceae bacterium NML160702]
MDFKRIQWLLLAFFVLFNIFLVTMLVSRSKLNSPTSVPNAVVNVHQQLQERGITIQPNAIHSSVDLSLIQTTDNQKLQESLGALTDQSAKMEGDILKSTFNAPVNLGIQFDAGQPHLNKEQLQALQDNLLAHGSFILFGEQYGTAVYYPSENILVCQMVTADGKPIVDGTAEIRLTLNNEHQVVAYTQTYQEGASKLHKQLPLITAENALSILDSRIETNVPNDSIIVSVDLGYFRIVDATGLDVYSPVWEVQYIRRDGTLRSKFVDAMRGQAINR